MSDKNKILRLCSIRVKNTNEERSIIFKHDTLINDKMQVHSYTSIGISREDINKLSEALELLIKADDISIMDIEISSEMGKGECIMGIRKE